MIYLRQVRHIAIAYVVYTLGAAVAVWLEQFAPHTFKHPLAFFTVLENIATDFAVLVAVTVIWCLTERLHENHFMRLSLLLGACMLGCYLLHRMDHPVFYTTEGPMIQFNDSPVRLIVGKDGQIPNSKEKPCGVEPVYQTPDGMYHCYTTGSQ